MSLRYLVENNSYQILYGEDFGYRNNPRMIACLFDKHTGKLITSKEGIVDNNIEKCLMTVGKRLIRRWRNRKK